MVEEGLQADFERLLALGFLWLGGLLGFLFLFTGLTGFRDAWRAVLPGSGSNAVNGFLSFRRFLFILFLLLVGGRSVKKLLGLRLLRGLDPMLGAG